MRNGLDAENESIIRGTLVCKKSLLQHDKLVAGFSSEGQNV